MQELNQTASQPDRTAVAMTWLPQHDDIAIPDDRSEGLYKLRVLPEVLGRIEGQGRFRKPRRHSAVVS
ncbi:hypothetical protein [Brevundimonas sp. UBA5936]|uniref:hypothetical protein n=1 Tax=Brevundimonas sp. UBA5936 TaxID=1946133 RepID=UPI0025BEF853|nr:hypothetical protein [Brevundimonas sp. UBA5936]